MSATIYNLDQAETVLSELVDRAAAGEEIIIARSGKPLARLTAFAGAEPPQAPGGWEGKMRIGPDFDAPLPDDLLDAFEGRGKD